MRIDGLDPLKKSQQAQPGKGPEPVSGQSFLELLSGLADKPQTGASQASPAAASMPVSTVPFLAPVADLSGVDTSQVMSGLDGVLTDLSMFKNALGNSNIPMERLKPIVDTLVAHKDELAGFLGKMPEGELKSLVSDTLKLLMEQVGQYQTGYAA